MTQMHLDDLGVIQCINYIRSEVAAGRHAVPQLQVAASGGQPPWANERYLQPVLENDGLLFFDYEEPAASDRQLHCYYQHNSICIFS